MDGLQCLGFGMFTEEKMTEVSTISDKVEQFFEGVEARRRVLTNIAELHKGLTRHFSSVEDSLEQKSQALDRAIDDFEAQTKQIVESLEARENDLALREAAMLARVREQRGSALADIAAPESDKGKNLSELLKSFCKRMDAAGLIALLLAKRKESVALKAEIAAALEESVDPMRLVLDAVEGFVECKNGGRTGVADGRWACGMLIQAAIPAGENGVGVGSNLREKAAGVLQRWKTIMGEGEVGGVGGGEASMFLQMVVGFKLRGSFSEEFLMKLVTEFCSRRDMAKLAVALDLGNKMIDLIEALVKSGKEVEAVYFATEAGLTDQFSPVALLKARLKSCRRTGNNSSKTAQEGNSSELNAMRSIVKCVEDHKIESQFPLDSLRKRLSQMEKSKSEKKKMLMSCIKPSKKRPQIGGGRGVASSSRPPKSARYSNTSPSYHHRRSHHAVSSSRYSAPYVYGKQNGFEGVTMAMHPHAPTPAPPQPYTFATQEVAAGGVRGSAASLGGGHVASYGAQPNYPPYDYGAPPHLYLQ